MKNNRPLDKSKKSNIKCEHCDFWHPCEETIEKYGVYSKETAKAMAMACRNTYHANIGVGVTGTFGNVDPNNQDSVPGKVFFAIDINGSVKAYERTLEVQQSRNAYKLAIAKEIVNELLKEIECK